MTDSTNFRQRLDAALRTLDVKQVQSFLITQNQWSEDVPEDAEFAMWIMVAGRPTLRDLHERARDWLMTHGHQEEAEALLGRGGKSGGKSPQQRTQGKAGQRPSTGQKDKLRPKRSDGMR